MKLHAVLALALTFLGVACAAPTETDESYGETESNLAAGVHIETQSNAVDSHLIVDRVIAMIDKTPNDGVIFAAIHSLDQDDVAKALVTKAQRGATVKVVMNGLAKDKPKAKKLKSDLAATAHGAFEFCGHANGGDGCISTAKDGIMHSKLFLFSKTADETGKARSKVTWMGSANMTQKTGIDTFNNAVAIYGDDTLHDAMKQKYFDHLWDKSTVPGVITSADSKINVFASPDKDDLVAQRLANLEKKAGTPCTLAISQNMIHFNTRPDIKAQVKRIAKFCTVNVLVNHINAQSKRDLADFGANVRYSHTHDKVFLVDGYFNGKVQKVAFTGSHNWTLDAQVSNDELLVRVADPDAYNALAGHLLRQWAASVTLEEKAAADAAADDDAAE